MKIEHVIIYLIIGGAFAGIIDRSHVIDCDEHIEFKHMQELMVLWPAIIVATIITKSTSKSKTDGVICIKEG